MTLETDRLILRPWEESDAEQLFIYAEDPQVGPPAGWPPHKSVEESLDVIRNVLNGNECYAVCLKSDGKPIGAAELMKNPRTGEEEFELGYWVGRPFWGRGIIPEASERLIERAFFELGADAVLCGYYDGNEKSRRVQEKLGFKCFESNENEPVPLLGEYRTEQMCRLTKSQWLVRKNRFDEAVYCCLKKIPKGKVITYGQIAEALGSRYYARAVGNALHRNPDPVGQPCYKVVNHQGALAKNFGDGGIETQKKRLEADGIQVENYRVDLRKYGLKAEKKGWV